MSEKYFDFMLSTDEYRKVKFRFYPKHSSLHLFDSGLKKNLSERDFKDVYKIYYSWGILQSDNVFDFKKDENGELVISDGGFLKKTDKWTAYKQTFKMECDECSSLANIGELTRYVIECKKDINGIYTFGQPGSDWNIHYHKGYSYKEYIKNFKKKNKDNEYSESILDEEEFWKSGHGRKTKIEYMVWDNTSDKGFRFTLDIDRANEFAAFIDKINQYMIEHGVPI